VGQRDRALAMSRARRHHFRNGPENAPSLGARVEEEQ